MIELLTSSDPWRRLGYVRADWEPLLTEPSRERESHVVCDSTGAFAGIAIVRPRFLAGDYLEVLAVAPARRGSALGTMLLAEVERVTFARARNLFVCVSDFNEGARRFYARHGYREIGAMPGLLVPGSSELLLRKTTGPSRQT